MSEIFLAEWEPAPGVRRLVVVKRLLDPINDDASAIEMFLDEARVALRLSHPNVVHTYDVGISDNRYCIAMEYLRGQPLHRVAQRVQASQRRLPVAAAVGIAIDVLAGLAYAHEAVDYDGTPLAVVHRDVSPHNVFLQYDGRVKLLDFGIAKASTQEGRTRTGLVKGKFGYMAPEQALATPLDHRADIWSVGVVLWELLAGLRLFKGNSEAATLNMTLTAQIPPVEAFRADVPEELGAIVRRALAREPEQRYPSAAAMQKDLERWLESSGSDTAARDLAPLMAELFDADRKAQERAVCELVTRNEGAPPSSQRSGLSVTPFSSVASVAPPDASVTVLVDELRRKDRLLARTFLTLVAFVCATAAGVSFALLRGRPVAQAQQAAAPPAAAALATAPPVGATPSAALTATPSPMTRTLASAPSVAPASAAPRTEPPLASAEVAAAAPIAFRAPVVTAQQRAAAPFARSRAGRDRAPQIEAAPSSAAPALQPGFLTIDTTPWSVVSVGGRVLGQTPVVNAALPAGEHALSLSNPELALKTTYLVRIEPGRTTVRRVGLE